MKKRKTIIVAVVLGVLFLLGVFGTGVVLAKGGGSQSGIVKKLAEKFNLDADEVEEVFDQAREEKKEEMKKKRQAQLEKKLDKAVEEDKITEEQKEAILEKLDELQKKHEELREEMREWAEGNDVDLKLLRGLMSGPRGHSGGGPSGDHFGSRRAD